MEQRDYYIREIEKIGLFLRKLLARVSSKNDQDPILNEYELIQQSLKSEIGIDLEHFLNTPSVELIEEYKNSSILDPNNIEILVDILIKVSESQEPTIKHLMQLKCLDLLKLSDENCNDYSLGRKKRIQWILERLN